MRRYVAGIALYIVPGGDRPLSQGNASTQYCGYVYIGSKSYPSVSHHYTNNTRLASLDIGYSCTSV